MQEPCALTIRGTPQFLFNEVVVQSIVSCGFDLSYMPFRLEDDASKSYCRQDS